MACTIAPLRSARGVPQEVVDFAEPDVVPAAHVPAAAAASAAPAAGVYYSQTAAASQNATRRATITGLLDDLESRPGGGRAPSTR